MLLAIVAPVVVTLDGKPVLAQVVLVLLVALVLLVVTLCLASALRPGSLGRFARRVRARRH